MVTLQRGPSACTEEPSGVPGYTPLPCAAPAITNRIGGASIPPARGSTCVIETSRQPQKKMAMIDLQFGKAKVGTYPSLGACREDDGIAISVDCIGGPWPPCKQPPEPCYAAGPCPPREATRPRTTTPSPIPPNPPRCAGSRPWRRTSSWCSSAPAPTRAAAE